VTLPANQYVLVACGLPKGFNPNEASWSGLPFDTTLAVMNARGTYDWYSYLEEAYDAEVDDFVEGWGDGSEEFVTAPIATNGTGFWLMSKTTTTLTISL